MVDTFSDVFKKHQFSRDNIFVRIGVEISPQLTEAAGRSALRCALSGRVLPLGEAACPLLGVRWNQEFYLEKIRVFKAGICPNTLAWNNRIGRAVLFCWFLGSP